MDEKIEIYLEKSFSTSEVAKILQMSNESIRRYINQGKLKARRKGPRNYVITYSALNNFLKDNNNTSLEELFKSGNSDSNLGIT